MKTNKQNGTQSRRICAIALIAIIAIAMATALIGCKGDDEPPPPKECTCDPKDHLQAGETCTCGGDDCTCTVEQPKAQTATITDLFDNNASATIQGNFTDTEWAGVADKIKNALNTKFNDAGTGEGAKNTFRNVFARGVTIVVEKTSEYANWKTNGDGVTMYINLAILNDESALQQALTAARASMASYTEKTGDPCNCPNETLHLVGETCCNSANCTCEKNVAGQRVEGIAVTNRDNVANFAAMVTNVTTALGWFSIAQQTYIKNNIKEIKVVVGTGGINPPSGGVFTVGNDCSDDDICGTLETWVDTNMQ